MTAAAARAGAPGTEHGDSGSGPTPSARPAHRDGNVLRWLAAYTASMIGDNVYFLALGWTAAQIAGPTQIGMLMAVAAVPRAVLMLAGGVVADRVGPRKLVIGSDAARCAVILVVAAALALSSPGLWLLVAVALVFGAVDALFLPAVGALPPRLTRPDQLTRVQGMRNLGVRAGNTAGPPLGGLAMGLGGAATAFAVAGALFGVSLLLLLAVRVGPLPASGTATASGTVTPDSPPDSPPDGGRRTAWRDLADGLRHIRRHRLIGPLVVSGAVSEFILNGPLNVGLVLLAGERGWGAAGMGWLVSAFGGGAGAGALLLTVPGWLPRAGAVQIAALSLASLGVGAIGLVPTLPLAVAIAGGTGLVAGVCGGLAQSLMLTAADPAMLGRVVSVVSLTSVGLAPVSYPLFGAASGLWGVELSFAVCGLLGVLAGAAVALLAPGLRGAELPRAAPNEARGIGRRIRRGLRSPASPRTPGPPRPCRRPAPAGPNPDGRRRTGSAPRARRRP